MILTSMDLRVLKFVLLGRNVFIKDIPLQQQKDEFGEIIPGIKSYKKLKKLGLIDFDEPHDALTIENKIDCDCNDFEVLFNNDVFDIDDDISPTVFLTENGQYQCEKYDIII